MIAGIWAEDENGLIGKDGTLPWRLPAELAHFKETTLDQAILMGRKTFDGMNKRALPRRTTIVLTTDKDYDAESDKILVMTTRDQVLDWYKNQEKDLYIIGGAQILDLFAKDITKLYRTIVHAKLDGDTYFPETFPISEYELVSQELHEKDEANIYDFTVEVLDRKK